jgi:hypothetical protein
MLTWVIGYAWTTCWVVAVALSYDIDTFKKPAGVASLLIWPITIPYMVVRGFFK